MKPLQEFLANTYVIWVIMFLAGILGGTVNYFQTCPNKKDSSSRKYFVCIIIGLAASMLVPFFLKTISSNLITGTPQPTDYLVFLGICIVAAIFSRRFIDSVGARILKEAKEASEKAEQAKQNVQQLSEGNEAIIKAINENIVMPLQEKLIDKKKEENDNGAK